MSGQQPIRVLLADDDPATRTGVRLSLVEYGFHVCAEADTADAAVAAVQRSRPDICVLEPDLPGGGISALQRILELDPRVTVVMLSASGDDDRILASLRGGARGYLLKDMRPDRLPAALAGALNGEAALPRTLMGRVLDEFRAREQGRHTAELARLGVVLTSREREVLELLDRGHGTATVGERLGISPVTVRRHASGIVRKLRARDRAEALEALRKAAE